MEDKISVSVDIQLEFAEYAMSPIRGGRRAAELFNIAPNPFETGRKNQRAMWDRNWAMFAKRLIWC